MAQPASQIHPCGENIIFISGPDQLGTITITNLLGETVCTSTCVAQHTDIDLSRLPSGTYIIRITGRLIKEEKKIEKQGSRKID